MAQTETINDANKNDLVKNRATQKEWLGLLVLALPCMLYSMDLTVLNLALPQLSLQLKPTASQLLWIVDIYGFFVAGSLITMGTLGDRIGRRKMLLIGGFVFAVASALAAFSNSTTMLIVTRALQGIAGATLAPSTLSLIRVLFKDASQRAQAIGLWGASFSVGALIGPVVGGFLIEHFWWGSVFLINIPVMILLLIIGPKLLPEYKDPTSGKMDFLSAGLSLIAILFIIFGLKNFAENGLNFYALIIFVLGLFFGFIFVNRQDQLLKQGKYPLIDLSLFKNSTFNLLIITNAMTMFVFFGTFIFTAQYMQLVMGLSPLAAGLWSLPPTFGTIFSSSFGSQLTKYMRPSTLMSSGLILGGIGFLLVSRVNGIQDLYLMVFATILYSMGSVPVLLFTTNMLVNSAPPEKASTTAAISETGNELGGATGIAILGSVGTFMYHREILKLIPENFSENIKNISSTTLANAVDMAKGLTLTNPAQSSQLIKAANTAFITAFQTAMLVAAVILFSLALLVYKKLQHVKLENEN